MYDNYKLMYSLGVCVLVLLFTNFGISNANDLSLEQTDSSDEVSFEDPSDDSQMDYEHYMGFEADRLNLDGCSSRDFPNYSARGQESTLRQVLLVHRHGDRTPIKLHYKDPLANEPFWKFHGYGQLTNRGKERIHMLGNLIRQRYKKFIKKSVSKSMIVSRSSGSPRCVESAQLFLSAFLPLDLPDSSDAQALSWNSGCEEIGDIWQPASIQTMSKSIDGMLAEGQCQELKDEYRRIDKLKHALIIHRAFKNQAEIVQEVLGYEMDIFYKWFWVSGDTEIERSYFHDRMDPRIIAIYDRLQEAGRLALYAYQSTVKSKRLRSGLLINDMLEHMKKSRQQSELGEESKRFIHYSTHDINVFSLLGVLGNVNRFPFAPDFGASIIMELHEDESGEWFVKIFYMPQVPSKLHPIHIEACEIGHAKRLCTLDKLEEVMHPYIIKDWLSWMRECRNDIDNIDPYAL